MVFDKDWFQQHQTKLLITANSPLTRWAFRKALAIRDNRPLIDLTPSSFSVCNRVDGDCVEVTGYFSTRPRYAKNLYNSFKLIWWLMHYWDSLVVLPEYNLGFDTLTANPSAGDPGTITVDGIIVNSAQATWPLARDSASGTAASSISGGTQCIRANFNGSTYNVTRAMLLFDTSSINAHGAIVSAVLSLASARVAANDADVSTIEIVSANPASNTTLTVNDFNKVGDVSFAFLNSASWVWDAVNLIYNDFTLNSAGRNNISKGGISKFATRSGRDLKNQIPTGTNDILCIYADGTDHFPQLAVTFTTKKLFLGAH
jgi:hypothetical protein